MELDMCESSFAERINTYMYAYNGFMKINEICIFCYTQKFGTAWLILQASHSIWDYGLNRLFRADASVVLRSPRCLEPYILSMVHGETHTQALRWWPQKHFNMLHNRAQSYVSWGTTFEGHSVMECLLCRFIVQVIIIFSLWEPGSFFSRFFGFRF